MTRKLDDRATPPPRRFPWMAPNASRPPPTSDSRDAAPFWGKLRLPGTAKRREVREQSLTLRLSRQASCCDNRVFEDVSLSQRSLSLEEQLHMIETAEETEKAVGQMEASDERSHGGKEECAGDQKPRASERRSPSPEVESNGGGGEKKRECERRSPVFELSLSPASSSTRASEDGGSPHRSTPCSTEGMDRMASSASSPPPATRSQLSSIGETEGGAAEAGSVTFTQEPELTFGDIGNLDMGDVGDHSDGENSFRAVSFADGRVSPGDRGEHSEGNRDGEASNGGRFIDRPPVLPVTHNDNNEASALDLEADNLLLSRSDSSSSLLRFRPSLVNDFRTASGRASFQQRLSVSVQESERGLGMSLQESVDWPSPTSSVTSPHLSAGEALAAMRLSVAEGTADGSGEGLAGREDLWGGESGNGALGAGVLGATFRVTGSDDDCKNAVESGETAGKSAENTTGRNTHAEEQGLVFDITKQRSHQIPGKRAPLRCTSPACGTSSASRIVNEDGYRGNKGTDKNAPEEGTHVHETEPSEHGLPPNKDDGRDQEKKSDVPLCQCNDESTASSHNHRDSLVMEDSSCELEEPKSLSAGNEFTSSIVWAPEDDAEGHEHHNSSIVWASEEDTANHTSLKRHHHFDFMSSQSSNRPWAYRASTDSSTDNDSTTVVSDPLMPRHAVDSSGSPQASFNTKIDDKDGEEERSTSRTTSSSLHSRGSCSRVASNAGPNAGVRTDVDCSTGVPERSRSMFGHHESFSSLESLASPTLDAQQEAKRRDPREDSGCAAEGAALVSDVRYLPSHFNGQNYEPTDEGLFSSLESAAWEKQDGQLPPKNENSLASVDEGTQGAEPPKVEDTIPTQLLSLSFEKALPTNEKVNKIELASKLEIINERCNNSSPMNDTLDKVEPALRAEINTYRRDDAPEAEILDVEVSPHHFRRQSSKEMEDSSMSDRLPLPKKENSSMSSLEKASLPAHAAVSDIDIKSSLLLPAEERANSKSSVSVDNLLSSNGNANEEKPFQGPGLAKAMALPLEYSTLTMNSFGGSDGIVHLDPKVNGRGRDDFDFAITSYKKAVNYGHFDFNGAMTTAEDRATWEDDDQVLAAKAYMGLGFARQCKGELESSLDAYTESLTLMENEIGQIDAMASIHFTMGTILIEMQRKSDASDHFTKALTLFKCRDSADGGTSSKASIFSTEGMLFSVFGEWKSSVKAFCQALLIHQHTGTMNLKFATIMFQMGCLLNQQGRYDASTNCLKTALEIQRNLLGDSFIVARTHHSLGVTKAAQELQSGTGNAAATHLEEALRICQQEFGAEQVQSATIIHALGILNERQGDFLAASAWFARECNMRKDLSGEGT